MEETTFLKFLKYCLSGGDIPQCVSKINWHDLLEFAQKQAIIGVFAYKILCDNKDLLENKYFMANKPTDDDVLEWMGAFTKIQRRNREINTYCIKVVNNFKKEGFYTCILKGQGNNLMYPDPFMRTSGDIDVWAIPTSERKRKFIQNGNSLQRLTLSDRMIIFSYVRNLFSEAKFKCQHIEFPVWRHIPVEVHFYPMYLVNPFSNYKLRKFYEEQKDMQFANKRKLPEIDEEICIPTPFFNAIYQLTHINIHLLIEGIGLRQLIDYYYVLMNIPKERHDEIKSLLEGMHLEKLAAAIMWIQKNIFGLPEEFLYIEPDEKRGKRLLKEVGRGGNFGKYDPTKPENEGFWHLQFRKMIQHADFIMDYPSEELHEPIFRICHFVWRQWYYLKWRLLFKSTVNL
ncbi:nucleotidyltransferase family protein [Prevotella sp. KH2C16]|uniref:nucleotidyltransferase family protein n=1 Tax=Prevotella sp. KH2C16 TaxID=1855325 RepID=UPI0008E0ECFE|nr:nucleotidyltransferase family protein [Prevotella sp. KH2C16]SFG09026.1 Uncharacterised nucleotidyltransferase [Prevotella sp. KH2C16]